MKLTNDDVHNWSAKYIQQRWKGKLTVQQQAEITAAEFRHHQRGTDAREEAAKLNDMFGLSE